MMKAVVKKVHSQIRLRVAFFFRVRARCMLL
jgi:hypothetical protein